MSQVVIDTDVLILHLRGNTQIREMLKEMIQSSLLCCSAITIGEIYSGMKDEEREKTELLLDSLMVFDVDRNIAELAGFYRRTVKSHHLELDDCLIAATCVRKKAVLLSCNVKHYPMQNLEKKEIRITS